jgi:hypothetical protein
MRALIPQGRFHVKTGDALGVDTGGDDILVAAGVPRVRVVHDPGLSN